MSQAIVHYVLTDEWFGGENILVKPVHRLGRLIIIAFFSMALVASIVLNWYLVTRGRQYYLQLNETRLDPLGLSYYPSNADQQIIAPGKTTVVFFGDSRVADWPAPNLPQFKFINRGIDSQTSAQALQRFNYHVKPLHPRIIIVEICINDLKTIPLFPERKDAIIADCKENIRRIVTQSTDIGASVILTTVFPVSEVPIERKLFWSSDVTEAINEVNAYIHSLEAQKSVIIFDAYLILADNEVTQEKYVQDFLHLNSTGYEVLNLELIHILTSLE